MANERIGKDEIGTAPLHVNRLSSRTPALAASGISPPSRRFVSAYASVIVGQVSSVSIMHQRRPSIFTFGPLFTS
jgi:hypothetical protein